MSNHFPSTPSSFNIRQVTYTVTVGEGDISLSAFDIEGVGSQEDGASGLMGSQNGGSDTPENPVSVLFFYFTTAGDVGSFDQDTVEGEIASMVDGLATAVSVANGVSLATAQGYFTVSRNWQWVDTSTGEFTLSYNDTMTYPAA